MKVSIIGCTHAGTAAAINTANLYKDAQITVYERNATISFLSCGIALNVQGVVKDPTSLFYCSPEKLAELGVTTKMCHDVLKVDTQKKTIKSRDLSTGQEKEEAYDKLIITAGSWPVVPKIENVSLGNILLCKNYEHAKEIVEKSKNAQRVAVVGAGYIGTELVEAFEAQGKAVVLIDQATQVLPKYLDAEFMEAAHKEYEAKGITLALGQVVQKFVGDEKANVKKVLTSKGEYEADLVILCVGFRPNTALFEGQLEMLPNGAIKVDEFMQTSQPDIFAAGDCCSVYNNASERHQYIPLATNAVRMGTLAARNLKKPTTKHLGTQGTSAIKIYDLNLASTGLTESVAHEMGFDVGTSTIRDNFRPEFMPSTAELLIKIVYDKKTRRILGAQIQSTEDLTQSINTLSVCIQNRMTVEELAFVDFFFQPHFNKPWNFLNSVALQALPPL